MSDNQTPNQKIQAGLNERAERKVHFAEMTDDDMRELNAPPAGQPIADGEAIIKFAETATGVARAFEAGITQDGAALRAIREKREKDLAAALSHLSPSERYSATRQQLDAEIAEKRRASGPQRLETLKTLTAHRDVALSSLALFDSELTYINCATVNDPTRHALTGTLGAQGPAALNALARQVMATPATSAPLAAAIIDRIAGLSPQEARLLTFTKRDLARACCGQRFDHLKALLTSVVDACDDAHNIHGLYNRGANPSEYGRLRIARGLRAAKRAGGS